MQTCPSSTTRVSLLGHRAKRAELSRVWMFGGGMHGFEGKLMNREPKYLEDFLITKSSELQNPDSQTLDPIPYLGQLVASGYVHQLAKAEKLGF